MHFVLTFLCNKLCQKSTKTLGVTGDINNRGKKNVKKYILTKQKSLFPKQTFQTRKLGQTP